MRVALRDLRGVVAGGMVTRYALLDEAAFASVEVPANGSSGTSLEEPCRMEHWGLVLKGVVHLHGRHERTLDVGTAFYVAPGRLHRFSAPGSTVVAGFVPVTEPIDESPAGLRSRGMEVVRRLGAPVLPPTDIRVVGARARSAVTGQVHTVSAIMGDWLFTRSTFGRMGGLGDGWCELPHWGQVIDGTLLLHWKDGEIELLSAGDIFSCPRNAGGHRIEVADAATMIDYTPISAIRDPGLSRAPRAVSALRAIIAEGLPGTDHRASETASRPSPQQVG